MEHLLGLLRVRVVKGTNLAVRDALGSDPYVVLRMGGQKLKTSVKKNNINPEWNEDLTLSISDPILPIKLQVYDKDTFSRDDKMGDADVDIQPFIDCVRNDWGGLKSGTIVRTLEPSPNNCIAKDSQIVWKDEKIIQDVVLKLRNVESGQIELQLVWVNIPGAPGF